MSQSTVPTAVRWVFHHGQFVRAEDSRLGPAVQGLHYGTGVFEGIRSYASADGRDSLLFRAREHYERLLGSARLLRIDIPYTPAELVEISRELIRRNGLHGDAYLRPLAYKLALRPGTPFGVRLAGVSDALTIIALPMAAVTHQTGISCGIASWRRLPDVCLPVCAKITGGYVNNALAVDEATAAGYDDAIMLDHRGSVSEASTANVFVVRGDRVSTPGRDSDILPGLTRAAVITILAQEAGVTVVEECVPVSDLYRADEIFLTGTGCQTVPVTQIAGRRVGSGVPGPVAQQVCDLYKQVVRGCLPQYSHWNTKVGLSADPK